MKLRIAHFESKTRLGGEYIIQRRHWLFWWTMATHITDGAFDDKEEALEEARRHLRFQPPRMLRAYNLDGKELL
jgi:hypothetical protein